jgi:sugar O-acyltransferase (sialic acid O-acetyltransferase NeuD family)
MKTIYILGSGGQAIEMLTWLKSKYDIKKVFGGFIDVVASVSNVTVSGETYDVIPEIEFLSKEIDVAKIDLFLGVGQPVILTELFRKYKKFNFPNFVHPSAILDESSVFLGRGNIVAPNCILTCEITVGNFNLFNFSSTIGHNSKVGSFNVFNPGCNVSGGVHLGDSNLFGTNSTVLQYLNVGDENIIGAGALLTKNVDDRTMCVGLPARAVKKLNPLSESKS